MHQTIAMAEEMCMSIFTGTLTCKLSEAFFILHPEDVNLLNKHLREDGGETFEQINARRPSFYSSHPSVRTTVPQPSELKDRLDQVMQWVLTIPASGYRLPSEVLQKLQKVHKNQLKLVEAGSVSGGPSMYACCAHFQ